MIEGRYKIENMQDNLKRFFADLSLSQLVALYNMAHPHAPVKKFTNRSTAIKRVIGMIDKWGNAARAVDGYYNFCQEFSARTENAVGVELP